MSKRALILAFREKFGEPPMCNVQGRAMKLGDEFERFSFARLSQSSTPCLHPVPCGSGNRSPIQSRARTKNDDGRVIASPTPSGDRPPTDRITASAISQTATLEIGRRRVVHRTVVSEVLSSPFTGKIQGKQSQRGFRQTNTGDSRRESIRRRTQSTDEPLTGKVQAVKLR